MPTSGYSTLPLKPTLLKVFARALKTTGRDALEQREKCSIRCAPTMAYRVELTNRAGRDLRQIYRQIRAEDSERAIAWFNGLETAVYSLSEHVSRGPTTPENKKLRHLLYGNKPHVYRIIYRVNERAQIVKVVHIRHGARNAAPKL
jgi:toxin ParE1/3/4